MKQEMNSEVNGVGMSELELATRRKLHELEKAIEVVEDNNREEVRDIYIYIHYIYMYTLYIYIYTLYIYTFYIYILYIFIHYIYTYIYTCTYIKQADISLSIYMTHLHYIFY